MKKSLIFKSLFALLVVGGTVSLTSCVKDHRDGAVDFSQLAPIMQIPQGGLAPAKFGSAGLVFSGSDLRDSVYFTVNYAAKTTAPTDINVTLAYDAAALAAFNAANPTQQYEKFPDSIYSFTTTSVTVKAGQSYSDPIKLVVFPYKVDPSKNYMLPISITNASGVAISGNFGTYYPHFIGNCLAGTYNCVGFRYNYSGGGYIAGYAGAIPPPAGYTTAALPAVKTLAAVNSTQTYTDYANLGPGTGRDIYIDYNCALGGTTVACSFTPSFDAGISNVAFPVRTYDPVLKKIHVTSCYNNLPAGGGSDRVVDETWTHQ